MNVMRRARRIDRRTILRGGCCAAGFLLLLLAAEWCIPSATHVTLRARFAAAALLLAVMDALWQRSRGHLAFFAAYTAVWFSPVVVQLLQGAAVKRVMAADAAVFGAGVFLVLSFLLLAAGHIRRRGLRRAARGVLAFLFAVSLVPPLFFWGYWLANGEMLSSMILLTLFQTNAGEAAAYLASQDAVRWCIAAAVLIAVFGTAFLAVLRLAPPAFQMSRGAGKLLCLAGAAAVLFFSGEILVSASGALPVAVWKETRSALAEYTKYGAAREMRMAWLASLSGLRISSGGVFILVIGESETRGHMGVYGYGRDTTPWLSSISGEAGTLVFSNAWSNHTHTVPSLTYALSAKNQYNDVALTEAVSIVEAAKAAGYRVVWVSNQRKYGAWDTPVAEIASTADEEHWLNGQVGSGTESDFTDEALIPKMPEASGNTLLVLHLMGCHGAYSDRYPREAAHFTGGARRVDEYDNAVRYNDSVLRRIWERAETYPNFGGMIFFSDHGEEVETGLSHEATKYVPEMARIPLIMRFTDAFRAARPETFETLRGHEAAYWTNDLAYDMLLTILGIEGMPETEPAHDLASPSYAMTKETVRTLHGKKMIED